MWWSKRKKAKEDPDTKMVDVKKLHLHGNPALTGTVTVPSTVVMPSTINSGFVYAPNLTGAAPAPAFGNVVVNGAGNAGNFNPQMSVLHAGNGGAFAGAGAVGSQFTFHVPPTVLVINGPNNQEIVRINKEGEVIWANGYAVDEAAEAFARSLHLSAEIAAGIRNNVKQKMRDVVFEEMISMAQEKGSLTADELTYLWQAAKIMDKLKGII